MENIKDYLRIIWSLKYTIIAQSVVIFLLLLIYYILGK